MSLLERYADRVKDLPDDKIDEFCEEIRKFLVRHVSDTGGHLASNLGVVELTVALHRIFDSSRDRLIFDVGHQCYVHKLLTGRREGFTQLRALGAMSGFPKPQESPHDAFIAGHASTSVSVAIGMARARTLLGDNYNCVAILGDGALTGGLAYEGLNDAGQSGEPLIVILNDNGMSITKNVGGLARYMSRLRLKPKYFKAKKVYHRIIDPIPGGRFVDKLLRSGKRRLKDAFIPGMFFEQMGFNYLGPVDGHDVRTLTFLLHEAISSKKPVLIHAITKKGKGYYFSEENPRAYHGVSAFNITNGKPREKDRTSFSGVFGDELVSIAEHDSRVCAITAAMQDGTGLSRFGKRFPKRFFDVGIAEEHAVTMAAAMAKQGLRPVVAIYSTFLQRSYDQLVHDVALLNLPVVIAAGGAGLVGEDGETHHGTFDPMFLSSIPGLEIFSPASYGELREMLNRALNGSVPAVIRYPRGGEREYQAVNPDTCVVRDGTDATIITYGIMVNTALKAAETLLFSGINTRVIKIAELKPLNSERISELCRGSVFLLEDCAGFLPLHFEGTSLNTGDRFIPQGTINELYRLCGIDCDAVVAAVQKSVKGKHAL